MKDNTKLYHCTNYSSLIKILESKYFRLSFCLEKAEYLSGLDYNFAFAMVCFADLLKNEVNNHLKRFSADAYIIMKKEWALKHGISIVTYYNKTSISSIAFKNLIESFIQNIDSGINDIKTKNSLNLMMAFYKQYEGHYWLKNKKKFSDEKIQFFTEREWRYIPIPKNYEAYYLEEQDFINNSIRKAKEQELVDKKYVLDFDYDDIEYIHVKGLKNFFRFILFLFDKGLFNRLFRKIIF